MSTKAKVPPKDGRKQGAAALARGAGAAALLFGATAWVYADRLGRLQPAGGNHWALWPLVAFGAWAWEVNPIKLHNRRVNLSIGLSDLPALVAVVYLSPVLALSAVCSGMLAASAWGKRKPSKALEAAAAYALSLAVGMVFYHHALAGAPPGSPRGWAAGALSLLLVAGVDFVAVLGAASFEEGHLWLPPPGRLLLYQLSSLAASYVGAMVAIVLIRANAWTVLLYSLMLAGAYFAFQDSRKTAQHYSRLAKVYDLTKELIALTSTPEVMSRALRRVLSLAHADRAEVVLPVDSAAGRFLIRCSIERRGGLVFAEEDGPSARDLLVSEALPLRQSAGGLEPGLEAALEAEGFSDVLAASLEMEQGGGAYLLVSDPYYHNYTFGDSDLAFLEALAGTVGVALRSSELLENLRRELATREYEASHDPLTGLPNREQFLRGLEKALAAPGKAVAAMLVDLDGFKEVNDALGHLTGDAVLVEVGRRLQGLAAGQWGAGAPADRGEHWQKGPEEVGPWLASGEVPQPRAGLSWRRVQQAKGGEPAARLGGDEFALLVVSERGELLEEACRGIVEHLLQPCAVEGLSLDLRASVGVATAREGSGGRRGARNLVRQAEVAMYLAKSAGGGIRFYTPAEDRTTLRRLAIATELRRALDSGGLDVWYQPVVEIASGRLAGCEALLRWDHEQFGPVSPVEFVPVAESSGLIDPITWWVLERSLSVLGQWRAQLPELYVSVNLSARSLSTSSLSQEVTGALARHRLPPSALTLELTESAMLRDAWRSEVTLAELCELGVRLAIDDYGTGFSSLSRLKSLPFSDLKIDRSFVRDLVNDKADQAIVRSTIELARRLGRTVTAEGVEDALTLQRLASFGCNSAQGFYLARPLPPREFEAWAAAWLVGPPPWAGLARQPETARHAGELPRHPACLSRPRARGGP